MSRILVRRSMTAVGIYSSVALGFAATVVAAHVFHSQHRFGDYAAVMAAAALSQSFFDLTVEEAVVKYGFRYVASAKWGRFRGLFHRALWFKLTGSLLGAIGLVVFSFIAPHRLQVALLLAAGIPLGQSLEGLAGTVLYLRNRYDLRALLLAWSMGLRLSGVAVGAHYGLAEAIAGVLAAQVLATATIVAIGLAGLRRPRSRSRTTDARSSRSSGSRASRPASCRCARRLHRSCSAPSRRPRSSGSSASRRRRSPASSHCRRLRAWCS
jgi:hypothetical protein